MIKKINLLICLIVLFCLSCVQKQEKSDPIVNDDMVLWLVDPLDQIGQYELFDPEFNLSKDYSNPYDAEEVAVDLILTDQNHTSIIVPCFFMEEYAYDEMKKNWISAGKSFWKVRFTPDKPGDFAYHIRIKDNNGTQLSVSRRLTVTSLQNKGFVRRYTADYLLFEDGSPFFANGFNLCIPPRDKLLDYEYFFRKWKANRMNYTRLWLAPPWGEYAFALEWTHGQFPSHQGKLGLKRYNQEVASRLDDFMQKAEEYGIYVMLCLGDERELETGIYRGEMLPQTRPFWRANPYNQVNGGPAATPLEFFILEEAKAVYKNRLRYLIARWGYSTNIIIWEFWNEIDHPKWCQEWTFVDHTVADWHQEMGTYIRQNDPYHHLISTSFAHENNQPLIWDLPEMDVVQGHNYGGSENLALKAVEMTRELKKAFPAKPMFISEYGTDFTGYTHEGGAEEKGIHNSIWASALSGATGIAQWWWWNTIDEYDLYDHYKNLGVFTENIPWLDCKTLHVSINIIPEVLAVGLGTADQAWLWVHNTSDNWESAKSGKHIREIKAVRLTIMDLPPGNYQISEYNTYSGEYLPVKEKYFESSPVIEIENLAKDIAFYVRKSN